MISARGGHNNSLIRIKEFYTEEEATKEDYEKALRAYQTYFGEVRSAQRDEAAAFMDEYKYY